MDREQISRALDIRYADLCFVVRFEEDCVLPRYKSSALRGGMGQMLLAQNCVRDRKCETCDFESECLVRRMMYTKYEIPPRFGGRGESIGYIIDCGSRKERFYAGETMEFHLKLFGKTIALFSQFLQAFYMLGQTGLGKDHARYEILYVRNFEGERVVDGYRVYLENLGIAKISSYAEYRAEQLKREGNQEIRLEFQTPLSVKYQGELLGEFHAEALVRTVLRRIYAFDCLEGNGQDLMMWDGEMPVITGQQVKPEAVRRYSSTQDAKMNLRGIIGWLSFDRIPDELFTVFCAGEMLHIGKNTSFGFGRYVMSPGNRYDGNGR